MEEHGVHRSPGRAGLASIPLDRGGRGGRDRPRRSGGNPRGAPTYPPRSRRGASEEGPPPDQWGCPRSSWVLLHRNPECHWPSERRRGVPSEGPGETGARPFGKRSPSSLVLPERRRISVARSAPEPAAEIRPREGGAESRYRHSGTRSELGSSPRRGRIQRPGDGSGGTPSHAADRPKTPMLSIRRERHGLIGYNITERLQALRGSPSRSDGDIASGFSRPGTGPRAPGA